MLCVAKFILVIRHLGICYYGNSTSNATFSSRKSIVKICSQTTKNKVTLAHNNNYLVYSAGLVEYWFIVTQTGIIVTMLIPSTLAIL